MYLSFSVADRIDSATPLLLDHHRPGVCAGNDSESRVVLYRNQANSPRPGTKALTDGKGCISRATAFPRH